MTDAIPTRPIKKSSPDDTLKHEVAVYFGQICACHDCGETRLSELVLDHKFGGGNRERAALKRRGSSFWREVSEAIARSAHTDHSWLATLQLLCRRCNTSKLAGDACTLKHLPDDSDETNQPLPMSLPDPIDNITGSRNNDLAADELTKLETRIPKWVKQYLADQGCQNFGEAITRIVAQHRSSEPTILAELRAHAAMETAHYQDLCHRLAQWHPLTPSPGTSTRPPWSDPEQIAAYTEFKTQWDRAHAIGHSEVSDESTTPSKSGVLRRLFS